MKALQQEASQCAEMIKKANAIVLLSGAGMSTNAGIPDFRGPQGLYKRAGIPDPERIFDIEYFYRDPSLFYSFHRELLKALDAAKPTFAHFFFAALEKKGKLLGIVTQNIDALHQRAGSHKVYEIHGGIWESHCTKCGKLFDYETSKRMTFEKEIPRCDNCGGVIKPDIVFFGEPVKHIDECFELARKADLFFVVGSSLVVTPAAMIPSATSGEIIVVNKGEVSEFYLPSSRVALRVDADIDEFFRSVNEELKLL